MRGQISQIKVGIIAWARGESWRRVSLRRESTCPHLADLGALEHGIITHTRKSGVVKIA
jgi:hypothetical protein